MKEIQGQYMGLLRITPESWGHIVSALASLPKSVQDKMSMTSALQYLILHKKLSVIGVPYENEWGEIDTPSDLEKFGTI